MALMNATEAKAKIDALVNEAYTKIQEAESIADENQIGFNWDLAYGMGGWYNPVKREFTRAEALSIIESGVELSFEMKDALQEVLDNTSNPDDSWKPSDDGYSDEDGWRSSSSSC